MSSPGNERTLALAGVFQAAGLVQQLARKGYADEDALSASVQSVLKLDADDAVDVFGNLSGVMEGLRGLRNKLGNQSGTQDLEIARYVMYLIQLQSKLRHSPWRLQTLSEGIQEVVSNNNTDEEEHNLCAPLAELYVKTISTLTPRIIVQGEEGHLSDAGTVEKVRACLLAGVRAGFLWHQLGGRRWHLLLQRSAYVNEADDLLAGMTI